MKKLYSNATCALLMLFSVSVVADQWSDGLSVDSLSTTRVDLTGTLSIPNTCISSHMAYLSPSQGRYQEMFSILLSSTVSGKQVKLYCADNCASGNRCVIKDVRILSD